MPWTSYLSSIEEARTAPSRSAIAPGTGPSAQTSMLDTRSDSASYSSDSGIFQSQSLESEEDELTSESEEGSMVDDVNHDVLHAADSVSTVGLVCSALHELRRQILVVSNQFPSSKSEDNLAALLANPAHRELVAQISYMAVAQKDSRPGWQALLKDEVPVLVTALISRALKEHVFENPHFADNEALFNDADAEVFQRQSAGKTVFRRKVEAWTLRRRVEQKAGLEEVTNACRYDLLYCLYKLIRPLYRLGARNYLVESQEPWIKQLDAIITRAIEIAHWMRERCPAEVFEWTEVFKGEELDPKQTDCINLGALIKDHPYRSVAASKGKQDGSKRPIQTITVAPGLIVWRVGDRRARDAYGPEFVCADESDRAYTHCGSFRRQVLMKSVAYCRWQKPRDRVRYAHDAKRYLLAVIQNKDDDQNSAAYKSLWDMFVEQHQTTIDGADGEIVEGR